MTVPVVVPAEADRVEEGGWAGLQQVVCVRTTHECLRGDRKLLLEDRHYLTRVKPEKPHGKPEALLVLARRHWEIENRLYHKKDRSIGEDAQRRKRGATVLARLRSLDVGLLPYIPGESTPLKQIVCRPIPLLPCPGYAAETSPKGCHATSRSSWATRPRAFFCIDSVGDRLSK